MVRDALVINNSKDEKYNIAKTYWILFFILLTIGALSIIFLIIQGSYFDYLHSRVIFNVLIIIYTAYLVEGIFLLRIKTWKDSQKIYLLFILTLITPAYLGLYNWGILHTHSILLLTTAIQLTYFLLKGQVRKYLLLTSISLVLIISILQLTHILPYDYITPSLYFHIPDVIILTFLITANLFGISIYYKSTMANIEKVKKLNSKLKQQNIKLKLELVREIHKKLNLKEELESVYKEDEVEQTYTNALSHIANNLNLLNKETYHRLNAQDFIHQISNMMQRFAFTFDEDKDETGFKEIQSVLMKYKKTLVEKELTPKSFNLSKLLYELKQESQYENITIELSIPNNLYITGIREKLKHVLLNLFINSINAGASKIIVNATKQEGTVHITIKDNGKGVSKKKLLSINKQLESETYSQNISTNSKGLNLGLITSKQIVERFFGGELSISYEGEGFVVEIDLS